MVRKADRGQGKFTVLTNAARLAAHTINITDNPRIFSPDHARSTETIVYLAKDIYHKARVANMIRLDGPEAQDNLKERRRLQNAAIDECDQLLSEIQIAKLLFHLKTRKVKFWGEMVVEVKAELRAWRDSDASRLRTGRR